MARPGGHWDGMGQQPAAAHGQPPWSHLQQAQHYPPGGVAYQMAYPQQMMYAAQQHQYIMQQQQQQQQWGQQVPQSQQQFYGHPGGPPAAQGYGAGQHPPSMVSSAWAPQQAYSYPQGAPQMHHTPQHPPMPQPGPQFSLSSAPVAASDPDDEFSDFAGAAPGPSPTTQAAAPGTVAAGVSRSQPIDLGLFDAKPDNSHQQWQKTSTNQAVDNTFQKGERVMYTKRDGTLAAATVVQVDKSITPYSYGIRMDAGSERETEGYRLQPIGFGPGQAPAGSSLQPQQQLGSSLWAPAALPSYQTPRGSSLQPQQLGVTSPSEQTASLPAHHPQGASPQPPPQPSPAQVAAAASMGAQVGGQSGLVAYASEDFGDFSGAADLSPSPSAGFGDFMAPAAAPQRDQAPPQGHVAPTPTVPVNVPAGGQAHPWEGLGRRVVPASVPKPPVSAASTSAVTAPSGDDDFGSFESSAPAPPPAAATTKDPKSRGLPSVPLAEDLFCEPAQLRPVASSAAGALVTVFSSTNPFLTEPDDQASGAPPGESPTFWLPQVPVTPCPLESENSGASSFGSLTGAPAGPTAPAAPPLSAASRLGAILPPAPAVVPAVQVDDDLDAFGDFGSGGVGLAPHQGAIGVGAGPTLISKSTSGTGGLSVGPICDDFWDFSAAGGNDISPTEDGGFGEFSSAAVGIHSLAPPSSAGLSGNFQQTASEVKKAPAVVTRGTAPLSLDLFGDEDHALENAPISLDKPAAVLAAPPVARGSAPQVAAAPAESQQDTAALAPVEDDEWGDFGEPSDSSAGGETLSVPGLYSGTTAGPSLLAQPAVPAPADGLPLWDDADDWAGFSNATDLVSTATATKGAADGMADDPSVAGTSSEVWAGPGGLDVRAEVPVPRAPTSKTDTPDVTEPNRSDCDDVDFGDFGSSVLPMEPDALDGDTNYVFEPEGSRLPEAESGFEASASGPEQRQGDTDSPGFDAFDYFGGGDDGDHAAVGAGQGGAADWQQTPAAVIGQDTDDFSPFTAEFSAPADLPRKWQVVKDESAASEDIFATFPDPSQGADSTASGAHDSESDGDFSAFTGPAEVGGVQAPPVAEPDGGDFGAFAGSAAADDATHTDFGGLSDPAAVGAVEASPAGADTADYDYAGEAEDLGAFSRAGDSLHVKPSWKAQEDADETGGAAPATERRGDGAGAGNGDGAEDDGFGAFAASLASDGVAWSAWGEEAASVGGISGSTNAGALSASAAPPLPARAPNMVGRQQLVNGEDDHIGDVLCALLELAAREMRLASQFWKAAHASGLAGALVTEVRFQHYLRALARVVFVWRVAAVASVEHLADNSCHAGISRALGSECNELWTTHLGAEDDDGDGSSIPGTLQETVLLTLSKAEGAWEVPLLDWTVASVPVDGQQLCALSRLPLSMFEGVVETVAWAGATECLAPLAALWSKCLN